MRFVLILLLISIVLSSFGQELDSLLLKYQHEVDYDKQLTNLSDPVKTTLWNDPDTAAHFAQEFKRVAAANQDTLEMARGFSFEGTVYYFDGSYDQAIAQYLESFPCFEEASDQQKMRMMYNNIWATYSKRVDPERTVEFYEKALEKLKEVQDTTWILNLNHNRANEYFSLGEIDKYEAVYNEA